MKNNVKYIKETKFIGGHVLSTKEEDRNGVRVGIVEGYIATWDIDRGDFFGIKDQFKQGAFIESIMEHILKKRQVRLKDHHGRTVGGFPIEFVKEDDRGLFGVGEINLEVQQGREVFMLAKQGVLVDFSIGFSIVEHETEGDLRTITKAIIWEGSVVDEPMNPNAQITQVKNEDKNVKFFKSEDVKNWTKRDVEAALREGAKFSKSAAKAVISLNIHTGNDEIEKLQGDDDADRMQNQKNLTDILAELKDLRSAVAS